MKRSLRIASMVLASLLFFSYNSLKAQVKIGGNPAIIDPNALLELESNRKGLLLPRLDDNGFNAMTNANATVGMVVYYTGTAFQGQGLYVKQTVGTGADKWVKIASADVSDGLWKITGNTGINPANHFIGTTDNQPLIFKTQATERFRMNGDGSFFLSDVGIPEDLTENQVLLLAPDGTIKRKSLDLDVVKKLNGLTGELVFKVAALDANNEATLDLNDPDLTLNLPVMAGNSTQVYGFMKLEDWEKLNNLITGGITLGTLLTDDSQGADGAVIGSDGQGHYTITLGAASAAASGVVTTGAQTFAGAKTFNGATSFGADVTIDNGAAGGNLTVKGKLDIGFATLYNPGTPPATYNLLLQEGAAATEVKRFSLPAWKLNSGVASVNGVSGALANGDMTIAVDTAAAAGADVDLIEDVATNKITLKIPDASISNSRGLVNGQTQVFQGEKVFNKSVTVGGTAAGSSNLQVNGSIGVKFRRIASGAINVDDYMILVKPTGTADVTVTLPDPADCSGRVYVIKREAKAYPVDDVQEDFSVIVATLGGNGKFHGENTTPMTVANTTLHVMSDGVNWQILSRGSGF